MYVNETLRFAEGNKSCVHLPCKISYPQLVSGRAYLLLAEPVKSIIHNCLKESDVIIQLSRMFSSNKSFKTNTLTLDWRFCQAQFSRLGVGRVIAVIRYTEGITHSSFSYWNYFSSSIYVENFHLPSYLACLSCMCCIFLFRSKTTFWIFSLFIYIYIYYFYVHCQINFGNVRCSLFSGWAVILPSYLTPPVCMTCE